MILEAARGLRAIKKPLAVCGDEAEMNKKLFFLLMLKKVMTKQKKRTRAAILCVLEHSAWGWICLECREDPSLAAMDEEDPLACLPMVREEAQVKPVPTWRRAQCGMCTVEFFSSSFLVSPPKLFPFQELQPGRGSWFQVFI